MSAPCLRWRGTWIGAATRAAPRRSPRWRGAIYALSLAVYCSSWTFYGAVGSATASPWSHAPIYLGPILVFVFAWPLLRRLMRLGTRHRVTSIADYLGARFGKRQLLSILVTAVATAAVLPYIALQFRALTQAWSIIASQDSASVSPEGSGLTVAIILALFTILFGARRMDGRERHQGMMSAVALESLVKFLAFLCVAILALLYLRRPEVAEAVDWSTQSLARVDLSADFFCAHADQCLRNPVPAEAVPRDGGRSPGEDSLTVCALGVSRVSGSVHGAGGACKSCRQSSGRGPGWCGGDS